MSRFAWFDADRYPLLHEFSASHVGFSVLPWSMSIVDCYFAFQALTSSVPAPVVQHSVRWENGGERSSFVLQEAYQIYDVDRSAGDQEMSLTDLATSSGCYWDSDERFVLLAGAEDFLSQACPYPEDIERHRFIEVSWKLNGMSDEELDRFYWALKRGDLQVSG